MMKKKHKQRNYSLTFFLSLFVLFEYLVGAHVAECALHAYSYYFILPQNVHYMMAPSPQYPLQYYYQYQRRTGSQPKKQQKDHCHHYQPHYQPYAYHHLAQYHPGLFS